MVNYKKNFKNLKIFVDFDGTISIKDLTDEIFKQNGNFELYINKFLNNEITIFEYWEHFVEILPNDLDSYLQQFLTEQQIDSYFVSFLDFCFEKNIPISVVTDNFDFIVEYVWNYFKLPKIPIFSNKLVYDNGWRAIFPLANENCGSHSAVCKRNVIINNSSNEDIIVYVGDGFSDFQAAEVSDIIFAKNQLAKYCAEHRIPHHNWKTFFDVRRILERYLDHEIIRKRHQASIHRKWAIEQE